MGLAGVGLLKSSEGTIYKTYRDPAGVITACNGHTGPELRMGMTFTPAQCEAILIADINAHARGLAPCIKVPVTQNQWDAMMDLTFNVGVTAVCKSTLVRKLNAGDTVGTSLEFKKWDKARVKGRLTVLKGLTARRTEEKSLFVTHGPPATPDPLTGQPRPLQSVSP